MKSVFSIVFALFVAVAMTACGKWSSSQTPNGETPPAAGSGTPAPVGPVTGGTVNGEIPPAPAAGPASTKPAEKVQGGTVNGEIPPKK